MAARHIELGAKAFASNTVNISEPVLQTTPLLIGVIGSIGFRGWHKGKAGTKFGHARNYHRASFITFDAEMTRELELLELQRCHSKQADRSKIRCSR